MRLTLTTLLAAAALFVQPAQVPANPPEIQFRSDYNDTRKEAGAKGLPIVIYCTTDNCMYCVRQQQDTFAEPTIAKMMNEKFVTLKVHALKEPKLMELLNIRAYPTTILAAPDGKILMTLEGYQDPVRFHDNMQRVLAAVSSPEWMIRDYQIAHKALTDREFAKGVALLRGILEDGKQRPVQVNAAALLKQVEQQAVGELAQAKQMIEKGYTSEGSALLTKLVKDYAGTRVAPEAAGMLTSMTKTPAPSSAQQRALRAQALLAQAREDYRTEQWLCCLDRCAFLANNFADMPEANEALQIAAVINGNPEWMEKSCESLIVRLGEMYLGLAETWVQKGQPQQAMLCLERVIRTFPGTRQAEAAQYRLTQLQGMPPQRPGATNPATPK